LSLALKGRECMPRSRSQWKSLEEMTPFARLLWDYMWAQGPAFTMAILARKIGVSQQSVADWFYKDSIPKPKTLEAVAEATHIPLDELYRAAGISLPATGGGPGPDDIEAFRDWLERSSDLSDEEREPALRVLQRYAEKFGLDGHTSTRDLARTA
jgi:transcriptional regulator with XRE-family HTH domain